MERDANYVAVGTFVIVVLAMATVFVLWYSRAQDRREYQRYEIYFTGSVSGLNEGSTVRYLGVGVGRVARIALDPRAGDRVEVLVDLDSQTPVDRDTLARLTPQGVTGLLFIDLSQAPPNASGVSPAVPSQRYPVIRSVPSNLDLFLNGLPDLIAQANGVITQLNALLSKENVAALDATLANVREASDSLPGAARDARRLLVELQATTVEARRVAEGADRLLAEVGPEATTTARRLREAADGLAATTARVDALIARNEGDLDRFAGQGLAELQQLAVEARDALAEVRQLARSLRNEPSQLLYERAAPGVEIAR